MISSIRDAPGNAAGCWVENELEVAGLENCRTTVCKFSALKRFNGKEAGKKRLKLDPGNETMP